MLNDIIKTLNSSITCDSEIYNLQEEEKYKSWLRKIPLLGDFLESFHFSKISPEITKQIGKDFMQLHIDSMIANSDNAFI
jgi:hypothetical protein